MCMALRRPLISTAFALRPADTRHPLGAVFQSYSPLGSGDGPFRKPGDPTLFEEPSLLAMAEKVPSRRLCPRTAVWGGHRRADTRREGRAWETE